jgi:protein phosphatase 2C family protein 2/3
LTFKSKTNLESYEQAVISYPEITKLKISNDIEFVITACDGIWDCVDIQKFCDHVSHRLKKSANKKISKIIGDLFEQMISKTNNSNNSIFNLSLFFSSDWH